MTFTFKHGDRPLEGYTIQRGVGRGGFGEVYYAISDSGKEVALKYLRDNPQVELRGVSHCMNLKSPYLVTVYDIRQNTAGEPFIIMEYVSGPSLRDLLVAEGDSGLGVQKAAYFLREIGKGLGYLHDRGIVHRDLKPGNIFYEDGYVKIGDYGLSKFISVSQHSVQTASVGTVHYMAPEVGSGNYGRGVDIYALGVILYEMLLGRVPYDGASMGEVLMKHLMAQPEVHELPAPFGEVITKSLAKDPKDRYQTVDEMTAAVFGVDDIRNSVARFEPTSVSMAAARAVPAQVAASVGGSSGQVNLPPRGTDAWGQAGAGGPGSRGQDWSWGDRWRHRREERREGMRNRLAEVEARLRNLEGVQPNDIPRFPPRSRWIAGLLGVFLGWLGVHRFYLGYTKIGIIQIVVTVLSSGTAGVWGIVEGILILAGVWTQDVYGRPLVSRRERPWQPILRERWLERLIFAAIVASGLSGGVALVYGGQGAMDSTFPTVLVFVVATTAAALVSSVLAIRLRSPAAPPLLGRVVVFGAGLLALMAAGAFCDEAIGPPQHLPSWLRPDDARVMERRNYERMLESLVGAVAVSMLVVDWVKRVRRGGEGRIELGAAVAAGVVAGIACCVFWNDNYFSLAAGIAATASLTVQSAAFFRLQNRHGRDGGPGDAGGTPSDPTGGRAVRPAYPSPGEKQANAPEERAFAAFPVAGETPAPQVVGAHGVASAEQYHTRRARTGWWMVFAALMSIPVTLGLSDECHVDEDLVPFAVALGAVIAVLCMWKLSRLFQRYGEGRAKARATAGHAEAAVQANDVADAGAPERPDPSDFILRSSGQSVDTRRLPLRSDAARVCWGLVAAALLAGAIMALVSFGLVRMSSDEQAVALGIAFACLGMQIFPLSKITRRRRYSLYSETLRPLFIAACLAAAGAALAALICVRMSPDETVVAIGFIVVPLVFALFFMIVRGPAREPSRVFSGVESR